MGLVEASGGFCGCERDMQTFFLFVLGYPYQKSAAFLDNLNQVHETLVDNSESAS